MKENRSTCTDKSNTVLTKTIWIGQRHQPKKPKKQLDPRTLYAITNKLSGGRFNNSHPIKDNNNKLFSTLVAQIN